MAGLKGTIYIKNKFPNAFLQLEITIKSVLSHMHVWTTSQIVRGIAQSDQISLFFLYKMHGEYDRLTHIKTTMIFVWCSIECHPYHWRIRVSFICSIRVLCRAQINESNFPSISVLFCWRWPAPLEWLWSYWPVPCNNSSKYPHTNAQKDDALTFLLFSDPVRGGLSWLCCSICFRYFRRLHHDDSHRIHSPAVVRAKSCRFS